MKRQVQMSVDESELERMKRASGVDGNAPAVLACARRGCGRLEKRAIKEANDAKRESNMG